MRTASARARLGKIRLLVADGNRMNCQLLISGFRRCRRIRVVAQAINTEQVMREVESTGPKVALISANLADGSLAGFSVVRDLRTSHPELRTILLLDSSDRGWVIDAFRAGAKGVFCRQDPLGFLSKCIQTVHAGQIWANSAQLESVLEAFARVAPPRLGDVGRKVGLSKREEQVAELVSEGLSNREIARQLRLSEHTIKNYLFHIFEKLGMSSRVELVLYAHTQETSQPESLLLPNLRETSSL